MACGSKEGPERWSGHCAGLWQNAQDLPIESPVIPATEFISCIEPAIPVPAPPAANATPDIRLENTITAATFLNIVFSFSLFVAPEGD